MTTTVRWGEQWRKEYNFIKAFPGCGSGKSKRQTCGVLHASVHPAVNLIAESSNLPMIIASSSPFPVHRQRPTKQAKRHH
ncbi:hypothetical protein TYRP_007886 [Tyrophagus putrescentiae]|nr:hypothetical protein TYRP_007886 [Tyrophagus putrescentiae]